MAIYISDQAKEKLPKRKEFDFYPTDSYYADQCVASLADITANKNVRTILDAGAGNSPVFAHAARRLADVASPIVDAVEIRPEACPTAPYGGIRWHTADYMDYAPKYAYDLIVSNPPYKLALQFVHKSLSLLEFAGVAAFLMPISFLSSQTRYKKLFQRLPPYRITFLPNRPSFSGDGKTTPNEYVWLTWINNVYSPTQVQWLPIAKPWG